MRGLGAQGLLQKERVGYKDLKTLLFNVYSATFGQVSILQKHFSGLTLPFFLYKSISWTKHHRAYVNKGAPKTNKHTYILFYWDLLCSTVQNERWIPGISRCISVLTWGWEERVGHISFPKMSGQVWKKKEFVGISSCCSESWGAGHRVCTRVSKGIWSLFKHHNMQYSQSAETTGLLPFVPIRYNEPVRATKTHYRVHFILRTGGINPLL